MSNVELAVQFFFQLAVILLFCRVVGFVAKWFGQPQVVAEMIAGVMLGPSLFGYFLPGVQAFLFPWDPTQSTRDTQSYLFPASQLGLALYMFVVGMEFRVDIIKSEFKASLAVSLAGMITPFVLGAGLAVLLFYNSNLFPERTGLFEASLFLGASMCITAFPMLARIIHFKKLTGTRMGTIAIGAGAIDDAAAWTLLAIVLASFNQDWSTAVYSVAGGVLFLCIAIFVVRPLLAYTQRFLMNPDGQPADSAMTIALACMCLGAWFTDYLGLHAVFGAFIIGSVMPRGAFAEGVTKRIEPLAIGLLLPLFFTYSGLNTKITLLNSWYLWGICAAVLAVAMAGKLLACSVAARMSGVSGKESVGIGALMNSRGLMELIIINIGLQRGVISEELFATLVIMAVVTTLMASPLFDFLTSSRRAVSTLPAST